MSITDRKPTAHAPRLLDEMPCCADEIPAWFQELNDRDFDQVCVSAVTITLVDEQEDDGFVTATSIARLTQAMRERYRKMNGMKSYYSGKPCKSKRRKGLTLSRPRPSPRLPSASRVA